MGSWFGVGRWVWQHSPLLSRAIGSWHTTACSGYWELTCQSQSGPVKYMNEGGCHVFFLTHCFWLHECFMFCVCWFHFLLYPFLVCSVLFLLVSYLLSPSLVCVSVSPLIFPGYRWSWEWDWVLSAATPMLLSWGNVGSPCPACYPGKLCVLPHPGPNSLPLALCSLPWLLW